MGTTKAPAWADTLESFRVFMVAQGKARGTVKSYWQEIRAFGRWCDAQRFTPVEAPETAVLAYIGRSYETLALATVQHRILSFRAFYHWLIAFGRRRSDPTRTLKLRPIHRSPARPYSDEELRALLAATENDPPRALRDKTILLLFIGGGLRLSELTDMQTQDIDWEAGRILVHGKGAKERWIAPGKAAMASLGQYLSRNREKVFDVGGAAVEVMIARRAEEAGVSGAHPHRFRTTFACQFSGQSGDIGALASILGHEDIKMSLYYAGFTQKARALDLQARLGLADRLVEAAAT